MAQHVVLYNEKGEPVGDVRIAGTKLVQQLTQAAAVANVLTFADDIGAVEIYHAEVAAAEFIVNGITLTVPPGGYRTSIGGVVGKTATIPAGVNCIVGRLV